jgi:hypothetical protein
MHGRGLNAYFNSGMPSAEYPCEVLAQDEGGEYQLPYPCEWRDGAWYGVGKTKPLVIKVIGWRFKLPTRRSAAKEQIGRG